MLILLSFDFSCFAESAFRTLIMCGWNGAICVRLSKPTILLWLITRRSFIFFANITGAVSSNFILGKIAVKVLDMMSLTLDFLALFPSAIISSKGHAQ